MRPQLEKLLIVLTLIGAFVLVVKTVERSQQKQSCADWCMVRAKNLNVLLKCFKICGVD
jgi:hypothetical protein